MAARIIIDPGDVWDYFNEHMDELFGSMKMIADNSQYGIEIYLTETGNLPTIMASADGEEIDEESCVSANDCATTVQDFYDKYLSDSVVSILMGECEDKSMSEELELIDERELEIDEAIYMLLDTLVPNLLDVAEDPDEIYEEMKERICESLYKDYGISVYRPMYLECEDGTDEFCEYPYPEMELDED